MTGTECTTRRISDLCEARFGQQLFDDCRVGQGEGAAFRSIGLLIRGQIRCKEGLGQERVRCGFGPADEHETAARLELGRDVAECRDRVREEHDPEHAHGSIERCAGDLPCRSVEPVEGHAYPGGFGPAAGDIENGRGDVDGSDAAIRAHSRGRRDGRRRDAGPDIARCAHRAAGPVPRGARARADQRARRGGSTRLPRASCSNHECRSAAMLRA
ncbi:MAG: hypothetical protein U5Q44_12840 [Dehalococcoidia bacterium]|nr:hypothetical protein [Dehalococcoidia bacterium]